MGLNEGPRERDADAPEGLRYREIATRLGVPMGTVATWLSRGRRALVAAVDAQPTERKGEAT